MYAVLKENGIAVKTDENIGVEFFEMEKLNATAHFGKLRQSIGNRSSV